MKDQAVRASFVSCREAAFRLDHGFEAVQLRFLLNVRNSPDRLNYAEDHDISKRQGGRCDPFGSGLAFLRCRHSDAKLLLEQFEKRLQRGGLGRHQGREAMDFGETSDGAWKLRIRSAKESCEDLTRRDVWATRVRDSSTRVA